MSPAPYGAGVVHAAAGFQGPQLVSAFSDNLHPAAWAEDFSDDLRTSAGQGVFFDFPRRTSDQLPVLSLGQLQHASLSANDLSTNGTVAYQPAYAVGNSYHHPHVTRGAAVQSRANKLPGASGSTTRYFDLAYLLNTALWDGYFFSGIRQSGSDFLPLNLRYTLDENATATAARSDASAAYLSVNGAFNINSTSVEAWVALLGGLNTLRVNDDNTAEGVPYPRTLWQPGHSAKTGSSFQTAGTGDTAYAGYRRLSSAEIESLAVEIVKRVRARGPFTSLSHFVNRSLVAASSDFNSSINDANGAGNLAAAAVPMGRGFAGPLQAAIDSSASGINTFINVGGVRVTADASGAYGDRVLFNGEIPNSLQHKPTPSTTRDAFFADKQVDSPHVVWDINQTAAPGPTGRASTGIPGWLQQGDLLQSLGPALSARSDTFVIRAYGEVVNPADTTQKQAGVWCEATVQRLPSYVDSSADTPETPPAGLNATNAAFGRGYKIVSFRWLSAQDI